LFAYATFLLRYSPTPEIRGWDRFQNRRQIASYTGLCPGIRNSNGRGREGRNRPVLALRPTGLPSVYAQYPQSRSQPKEASVPPSGTYSGQTQPSKPARSMASSTNR
jgi:Transposase IS116/IS110/IS902 family